MATAVHSTKVPRIVPHHFTPTRVVTYSRKSSLHVCRVHLSPTYPQSAHCLLASHSTLYQNCVIIINFSLPSPPTAAPDATTPPAIHSRRRSRLPQSAHAGVALGIMTGRTRRGSTSSVDTVDGRAVQWRQEASILRSVPKTEPSDNWPIFQLRDAIVLNRDGTTVENALHIVPNGPFIVRGNLHFSSDEKRFGLSIPPTYRPSVPADMLSS